MKLEKITTSQMELLVYEYFEKSSLVVVPRFDSMNGCRYEDKTSIWGTRYERIVNHECDILSVSKKLFLREIEIKVSVSDFKADFKKKHQHLDENIKHFYYAVPDYILDKIKPLVPENAGILVAKIIEKTNRNNEVISKHWIIKKYKSPKSNNLAKPIDNKKLNAIFRIGYLKYWFHRKRTENKRLEMSLNNELEM
ncbi:MAG: MmcB family DNA repair protein [Fusobacterium gastrosuis]|uniref:MmcB family DNA repair protein n=1 Tax=Fusobacterium gastrosuis TaxID=1755100 RepID=UPI002A9008F9|nr:MmcB family DNA repair protein [Fusobacterium gastrosuis]